MIVTDGFTGNVALKAIEGTARLVGDLLRQSLTSTLMAKLGALMARGALSRLQRRIDPRRVNGGVFLGLNGTVVKSHGSADATGVSAAIMLAAQLAQARFLERLAARVASADSAGQDAGTADPGLPDKRAIHRNDDTRRSQGRRALPAGPDRSQCRVRGQHRHVGRVDPHPVGDRAAAFRGRGPDHV